MPPQVNPAGSGCGPIQNQTSTGVEEVKSCETEKKTAEPQKDSSAASTNTPHRATPKEASNRKAELAAGGVSQQMALNGKLDRKAAKSEKGTTQATSKEEAKLIEAAAKANATIMKGFSDAKSIKFAQQANDNVMDGIRKVQVDNLRRSQYPQDMVKGQYFEVEKITPGKTDTFKNNERVEDRGRGDVTSRHYHQETQRTSTQSGLEDRLQVLNAGKELTQFEKGLISEWDPQTKGTGKNDPIRSVSPIMGMDSKGGGPTGVQAYKVQRGNYSTYYDRNGNVLVDEGTQQNRVVNMDRRKHQQDMVKGEYYVAEQITPGTADKTKTSETVDVVKQRIHKEQNRTSTPAGLENRLKELNPGKDLTPFEKGLVNEWDPKMKGNNGKDGITSLSPVMGLDSAGKTSNEVQAYRVARGVSGNHEVTYYDRNGNEFITHKTGGEAIPTDGPVDYIYLAKLGAEALVKKGVEIGERFLAKETQTSIAASIEHGVAKEVAGDSVAIANSAEKQAAKDGIATAERRTASQSQQARPQEPWEDINAANKQGNREMSKTTRQEMDNAGNTSSEVKDPHVKEKTPAESTKPAETKGPKMAKSSSPPRPVAEIEAEIKEAQAELEKVRKDAEAHVNEMMRKRRDGRIPVGSLETQLRDLANQGDEMASRLLGELTHVQRRLRNLHREKGVLKGDPESLP